MRAVTARLLLLFSISPVAAFGQATTGAAGPQINRADLATSYLRIEQTLRGQKLDAELTAELNKGFDQSTLAFFQKKYGDALRQIDSLMASLAPPNSAAFMKKAAALRVSVDPPVIIAGAQTPVALHLQPLYLPGEPGESIEGQVVLKDAAGKSLASQEFRLRFEKDRPVDFVIHLRGAQSTAAITRAWIGAPGRYFVWITGPSFDSTKSGGPAALPTPSARFIVAGESLNAVREKNAKRLEAVKPASPAIEQALSSLKARNALLSDAPDPENTAQFVLDPLIIAKELETEIAAVERGEDPFKHRKGDYWRVFISGDTVIPIRVYLPESLDAANPLPLVVAFHGAGVDENAFMDAYGAGMLKRLAAEKQFLLVTPLAYGFRTATGTTFDALLAAIENDYAIDPRRIYVMGHSMGGGVTTSVVAERGATLAAAVTLCGFQGLPSGAKDIPPMMVYAAQFDPLANPTTMAGAAATAKGAGLPVEFKLMANYGHTLVVGEVLPQAIDWMLAKRK